MLNQKIDKFLEVYGNTTSWQETLRHLTGFSATIHAVGFVCLIFGVIFTLFSLCLVILCLKKPELWKSTLKENKERVEGKRQIQYEEYLMTPRFMFPVTLTLVIIASCYLTALLSMSNQYRAIDKAVLDVQPLIFTDYLDKYEGDTLKPKETVTPSAIKGGNLYVTSFNIEGVQYNNRIIYITYSNKYPTDTLIPFDASDYKKLLPTDSQREKAEGFKLTATSLSNGFDRSPFLDDVDYIYNIKIEDK